MDEVTKRNLRESVEALKTFALQMFRGIEISVPYSGGVLVPHSQYSFSSLPNSVVFYSIPTYSRNRVPPSGEGIILQREDPIFLPLEAVIDEDGPGYAEPKRRSPLPLLGSDASAYVLFRVDRPLAPEDGPFWSLFDEEAEASLFGAICSLDSHGLGKLYFYRHHSTRGLVNIAEVLFFVQAVFRGGSLLKGVRTHVRLVHKSLSGSRKG